MSQTILATRFNSEVFTSTVKACFDAMKQHKQRRLFQKTYQNLHADELERIRMLTEGNRELMQERYRQNVKRAFDSVRSQFQKKVWSYFNHWRKLNIDYHDSLRTTLSDKLTSLYMEKVRVSISRWKLLHSRNKLEERQSSIKGL